MHVHVHVHMAVRVRLARKANHHGCDPHAQRMRSLDSPLGLPWQPAGEGLVRAGAEVEVCRVERA